MAPAWSSLTSRSPEGVTITSTGRPQRVPSGRCQPSAKTSQPSARRRIEEKGEFEVIAKRVSHLRPHGFGNRHLPGQQRRRGCEILGAGRSAAWQT